MNSSMHCRSHILLREFSSEVANIDRFCGDVRRMLAELGLTSQIFPIELLLRESLNNAMLHGNAGDIEKTIEAEVRITRRGILLRVTDQGSGFERRKSGNNLPDPDRPCGRGLAIYSLYAHRVSFNSSGNRVSLWRTLTGEEKL